jgi:hypothetical protein
VRPQGLKSQATKVRVRRYKPAGEELGPIHIGIVERIQIRR